MPLKPFLFICATLVLPAGAQQITPDFAAYYTISDLGSPSGVPTPYGGFTFLNENTLLFGARSGQSSGQIYSVGVTRDPITQHITGFTDSATFFANAPYIDGGLTMGPGGVLFYTSYDYSTGGDVGQIKPGSTNPDKITSYASIGLVGISVDPNEPHQGGGVQFVPSGFAGAGQLKLNSYYPGVWNTLPLTPDGNGTYNLGAATGSITLPGFGYEGLVYVNGHNAGFNSDSVLMSYYTNGRVIAYEIDSNGDPIPGTQRDFLTGLTNIMGATIDPVTGDALFNTFVSGHRVVAVSGFIPVPEPGTAALAFTTLVAWSLRRRR